MKIITQHDHSVRLTVDFDPPLVLESGNNKHPRAQLRSLRIQQSGGLGYYRRITGKVTLYKKDGTLGAREIGWFSSDYPLPEDVRLGIEHALSAAWDSVDCPGRGDTDDDV